MRKGIHGEVLFVEGEIPSDAKKVIVKDNFYVVGESETHGNSHRVAVKEGVELFKKDGVLYIKNEVETEIFCPNKERHDTAELPIGEWPVGRAREFDYLNDAERVVID